MLDAAFAASEVLRMMCAGPSPAQKALQAKGKALQCNREALLTALANTAIASPLSIAAADGIAQVARNCPFFKGCYISAFDADGSNAVCQPVMSHVLKGSVNIPEYVPCDCYSRLLIGFSNEQKAAIGKSLTVCRDAVVAVPQFFSVSVADVSSAVSVAALQSLKTCGRDIVAAMPPNHQCGNVSFTRDDDGFVGAALHMVVCEKMKGSYDAACECVSCIGYIISVNCKSGTTVTKATKDRMDQWINAAAAGGRVPLIADAADVTDIDALLHLIESDKLQAGMKCHPATHVLLPTLLLDSAQAGAQAFVDKYSGFALIDREEQITHAVAALQPVVSGIAARDSMHAALIWGPPGTGKSQSAEAALFRLNESRAAVCCMDNVNCRYPSTVASGLVLLGRRMGKTLAVGPDATADDVLKALQKHFATIPCVPCSRF
jgi:hypothetical protein